MDRWAGPWASRDRYPPLRRRRPGAGRRRCFICQGPCGTARQQCCISEAHKWIAREGQGACSCGDGAATQRALYLSQMALSADPHSVSDRSCQPLATSSGHGSPRRVFSGLKPWAKRTPTGTMPHCSAQGQAGQGAGRVGIEGGAVGPNFCSQVDIWHWRAKQAAQWTVSSPVYIPSFPAHLLACPPHTRPPLTHHLGVVGGIEVDHGVLRQHVQVAAEPRHVLVQGQLAEVGRGGGPAGGDGAAQLVVCKAQPILQRAGRAFRRGRAD